MELIHGEQFMISAIVSEFFGTMGYMLAFNMTDEIDLIPLVLFSMVVLTMKISGGHMNPAVTLGVYIERKKYWQHFCYALTFMIA
jgi:hypothetical protein